MKALRDEEWFCTKTKCCGNIQPIKCLTALGFQTEQVKCKHSVNVFSLCFLCQGEEKIQTSDHYNMFERSGMHFLEICHVCSEDAGIYTCLVANNAGKASATAELIVQGMDNNCYFLIIGNFPKKMLNSQFSLICFLCCCSVVGTDTEAAV